MKVEEKSSRGRNWQRYVPEPLRGAFFWLSAFYLVYCARPEDWIPGLKYIPLAKITGIFALLALIFSAGRAKRGLRDLPREAYYLVVIMACLVIAGFLSPVWKGGALSKTLDFTKMLVAWLLTFFVITTLGRLKRIIWIQSASVAVIAVVSMLKGRNHPRLEGVIGGIYSNPNDLAFAIVLSLPFCVAFLLHTKKIPVKLLWLLSMLVMCAALFLTASRGGFITLLFAGSVGLWHFGVRGRRPQLIAAVGLVTLVIGVAAGGRLKDRFLAISADEVENQVDLSAHGSFEQRRLLMERSVQAMVHYPLGIGLGNFANYSGTWREVHVAYLQIGVEGGIVSAVFYVMFFAAGFSNLRWLRRMGKLDASTDLFVGALHSSLVGFVVGALFAPEAYQFFPYFAVAYTSVLVANARENGQAEPARQRSARKSWHSREVDTGELAPVR